MMEPNGSPAPEEREIPIVMAFDPGFLLPSAVAMVSAMENGGPGHRYRFYILTEPEHIGMDGGLFDRIADLYPNYSYEYVRLDIRAYSASHLPMHITSQLTFARLLIPECLPELDACIYLDGDMLIREDLRALWARAAEPAFDQVYLLAAPDLSMQNGQADFFRRFRERIGWDDLEGYFNAGVLVMNLRALREDGMPDRFREHADGEYFFGDQDILNICCRGKTAPLPVRWNMFPGNIGDEAMLRCGCTVQDAADLMSGRAAILHFAGADKPWKCMETVWEREWLRYAEMLPRTPLTEPFLDQLRAADRYRLGEDETDAVRRARRYLLYGYTEMSRKLLDRLEDRRIGTPWCFCDADPEKRGESWRGVPCRSWEEVRPELDAQTLIILCAQSSWREIREALLQSGVPSGQIIRYRKRDFALVSCGKKYGVGLLMGVFDLFHIGHLNLIRRAKEQCSCLRVGVLSDELVHEFKQIYPTIPQDERMELLRALRDVDEVVLLETREDVSRLREWHKRPFDCFFSGDDYAEDPYWAWERQELKKLGADMVFFPYTKERSSTMIRNALKEAQK